MYPLLPDTCYDGAAGWGSIGDELASFVYHNQESPDRAGDHPAGSARAWNFISWECDNIFLREGKRNMPKLSGEKQLPEELLRFHVNEFQLYHIGYGDKICIKIYNYNIISIEVRESVHPLCCHDRSDESQIWTKIPPPDGKEWSVRTCLGTPIMPPLNLE